MNVPALEPVGIASSVPAFVGLTNDLRQPFPFRSQLVDQLIAQLWMLLDQGPFLVTQAPGLRHDRWRDGEEADVMDKAGQSESFKFLSVVA